MREIETTAKTKEEAIEIALKELGVDRRDVEIDVVSVGKAGILGIGSEPARVRVALLEELTDVVRLAADVLENLIAAMGVSAVANLKQAMREDLGGPVFDIAGEDSGLLIGRRGETLKSIQFLVRFIVGRQLGCRANLMVDVEGYQERRYHSLTNLAEKVARRVISTGRSIALEPMPADERRVVHLALAEHPRISTESLGVGEARQVVIQPNDE